MEPGIIAAAARKRLAQDDAPTQQPMRPAATGTIRRNPSTDQKKVRKRLSKSSALSAEDRAFLVQHATAYAQGDTAYADWYMEHYGDDADSLDDVPDHPVAWRRYMEWRDQQPLDDHDDHETGWLNDAQATLTTKEPTMTDRPGEEDLSTLGEADLLDRLARAHPSDAPVIAQALVAVRDRDRVAAVASRSLDFSASLGEDAPAPVTAPQALHTTATDWIADEPTSGFDVSDVTKAMVAEASAWFTRLHEAVKDSAEEYAIQATGMARRHAGQYGEQAPVAERAFLDHANHLRRRHAGTDPNDQSGDAGSRLPDALDGADDDEAAFEETGWDGGENGQDPKTEPSDTPSLAEGDAPEGGSAPQIGNPESDKTHDGGQPGDAGTVTRRNDIDGDNTPAFAETGWKTSAKTAAADDPVRADDGYGPVLSRACAYGEAGYHCDGSLSDGGQCECSCHDHWNGRDDIAEYHQRFASKTASTYCPAHGVYVGEGNQEQHDHCKTEQRETKDSAKIAVIKRDGKVVARVAEDEVLAWFQRTPKVSAGYALNFDGFSVEGADGAPHPTWAEYGRAYRASLKVAEGGQTCATCGHPIERDPAGEEPRTWHHSDGESHDHEARPGGGEKTAATYPGFYRTVTHPDGSATLEWVPERQMSDSEAEKQRLFPDGIPLHGDLTPEQEAWLKKRGSAEPDTMTFFARLREGLRAEAAGERCTTCGEGIKRNAEGRWVHAEYYPGQGSRREHQVTRKTAEQLSGGDHDESTGGVLADGWEDPGPAGQPRAAEASLDPHFLRAVHAALAPGA